MKGHLTPSMKHIDGSTAMKKLCGFWLFLSLSALSMTHAAVAQRSLASMLSQGTSHVTVTKNASAQPANSAESALQSMFTAADVVFTGQVVSIKRAEAMVEIVFRVDDAVRGVAAGDVYTLREWSGLWVDQVRYVVGDRRLMLLHATSVAGLASPVGGTDGAIPVAGNDATGTVDLRWVAARVARQSQIAAQAFAVRQNAAQNAVVSATTAALDTMARADRGVVMDLLHSWQKQPIK